MNHSDLIRSDVRVVVTGLGLLTPLGLSVEENWEALMEGRSGIGRLTRFSSDNLPSQLCGEVRGFEPENYVERKELKKMDVFIQYVLAVTQMAFDDAGLTAPDSEAAPRYGAIIGVGLGGLPAIEANKEILENRGATRISPFFIPMLLGNLAAGQVSMRWGLKGPNVCTTTACASGNHAIGDAMKCIQRGVADVMVAGGSESCITELAMAGFCAMRALSTRNDDPEGASRPFDVDRDGFVMAEGAGVMILENYEHAVARGAEIYAELTGYGLTSDAHHITSPDPGGEGAARCMAMALDDAGLAPESVDYVNAHGHLHGGGRRAGNDCHQENVRRSRLQAQRKLDEIDDGASFGCSGGRGICVYRADARARAHSAHHQPAHPRSGMRPRLRSQHCPGSGYRLCTHQLVRVRGNQRLAPLHEAAKRRGIAKAPPPGRRNPRATPTFPSMRSKRASPILFRTATSSFRRLPTAPSPRSAHTPSRTTNGSNFWATPYCNSL